MNRRPQPGERVKFTREDSPINGKWGIVVSDEARNAVLWQYGAIFTFKSLPKTTVMVEFKGLRQTYYRCNFLNLNCEVYPNEAVFDLLTEGN